ncbi:hypothetical protein Dimus_019604 [Dionaea muscipula]
MMMMAESRMVDDRKEVGGGGSTASKSPWKRPVDKGTDAPVMGAESWPALADAQRPKNSEVTMKPPLAAANEAKLTSPSASPNPQGSAGFEKKHGSGSMNSFHKHGQSHHHKGGFKRIPIGGPPFPAPPPLRIPAPGHAPYRVFPLMIPPPVPITGYGYLPFPPPFSAANNFAKSEPDIPIRAFIPPGRSIHPGRNIPSRGDSNVHGSDFSNRRCVIPEAGTCLYPAWHHQRAIGQRHNILMQQSMGMRPYMRPPLFRPPPAFGPGTMFYLPATHPASVRAPFPSLFVPHPMNTLPLPMLPPEMLALRDNIVKQIEYYFSDKNLKTDHYLISLMDDKGWVPVSAIAEFNRVKKMSTNILFILDALRSSELVEVQGDKVRKCANWSDYVRASKDQNGVSVRKSGSPSGGPLSRCDGKISVDDSMNRESVVVHHACNIIVSEKVLDNEDQTSCQNLGSHGRLNSQPEIKSSDDSMTNELPISGLLNAVEPPAASFAGLCLTNCLDESTFELEMEQKLGNRDDHSSVRRMDDEDDDQDVDL